MRLSSSFALLSCLACAALPTAAHASSDASTNFRISATVPEACEIVVPDLTVDTGSGLAAGTVLESCNTQRGFQVVASYRPLDPEEKITLTYAGQSNSLHADGWQVIANRAGAQYGARPVSIWHDNLAQPLTINLTITYF
ncbi:hypothetical protein [Sphingopyxis sp. 550A]